MPPLVHLHTLAEVRIIRDASQMKENDWDADVSD